MTAKSQREAGTRGSLSKEAVVRTAISLADEKGVASLTMRNLAEKLGVEAMSLYYHVANKNEILDGMFDAVFGEIAFQCDGGLWKQAMRERAQSLRKVLLQHRWAIGLMESRPSPGEVTLSHHESVIKCLRTSGFSIANAAHAFSALDSYIYGFVMQEASLPFETSEELEDVADNLLEQMPVAEFPYFVEMIAEYNLKPGYSYSNEFEIGLDLILDGLERIVDKGT